MSVWMQERPLQVFSLGEPFLNARIMDRLVRTCVPLVGEHVGNVPGGVVAEEDIIRRGGCPLPGITLRLRPPRQYEQEGI
jgi:hypothetical protein